MSIYTWNGYVVAGMGHANPNVTLAVYSHALQSADKRAADLMENIVLKKAKNDEKYA